MDTDYFALRIGTLTTDLPLSADVLTASILAAQQTFEDQRRAGASVDQAIDLAEAELLEAINPIQQAASRLKDLLAEEFEPRPELAHPPHFPVLLQKLMPLLMEPPSRLADVYILGLVIEYAEKNTQNGL